MEHPTTIAQLRQSEYRVLPVKEEMRKNLVRKIKANEELFPGIIGFEGSVITHRSVAPAETVWPPRATG